MEFPPLGVGGGIEEGFAGSFRNLEGVKGTPALPWGVSLLVCFSLPVTTRAQPFLRLFVDGWCSLCLLPVPTGNSFAPGLTRVHSYEGNVVPCTRPLTKRTPAG